MQFHKEMETTRDALLARGFRVYVPGEVDDLRKNEFYMKSDDDRIEAKIEYDLIREHFRKVKIADVVLILNYEKKGIEGYIGGNTFLEMGYAFGLGKQVYLLNPIPKMDYYTEMVAIQPIVLHGNLKKLQKQSGSRQ